VLDSRAMEFRHKDFLEGVKLILKETGLPAEHLELELTESILMQDAESSATLLEVLKSMGVQLAIDDFGTGYSSLSYLKRFPIDTLKIDQSFVRDITNDADSATIVVNAVNDAPTLDAIADLSILKSAPAQTVNLGGISAGPADENGQTLTLMATSSNPALIPNPIVTYNNGSTTGTLSFTPTAGLSGSATIMSMSPSVFRRAAVMPMISAASLAFSALFQRMDAQPSGEITA